MSETETQDAPPAAPAPSESAPAPPAPMSPNLPRWMSISGWYGVVAILGAYWLVSNGALDAKGVPYQVLNLTGAIAISIVSFKKHAWQPLALNALWAVIAAAAIWKIFIGG